MDNEPEIIFEDIVSTSVKEKGKIIAEKTVKAVQNYGNGTEKFMDKIIKFISFLLAIVTLLIFVAGAAVLIFMDKAFMPIAIVVGVVGVIASLIVLFLIYGLGHIISQNNEIIKLLKK